EIGQGLEFRRVLFRSEQDAHGDEGIAVVVAGVKASLSTDHTTNYNCDPFVAMRVLFALHQHRIGNKIPLTVKRLVQLATLDGARSEERRVGKEGRSRG